MVAMSLAAMLQVRTKAGSAVLVEQTQSAAVDGALVGERRSVLSALIVVFVLVKATLRGNLAMRPALILVVLIQGRDVLIERMTEEVETAGSLASIETRTLRDARLAETGSQLSQGVKDALLVVLDVHQDIKVAVRAVMRDLARGASGVGPTRVRLKRVHLSANHVERGLGASQEAVTEQAASQEVASEQAASQEAVSDLRGVQAEGAELEQGQVDVEKASVDSLISAQALITFTRRDSRILLRAD
jgi:murein DD-endopeptidase MepM/ murein hydrolase activator NlpD